MWSLVSSMAQTFLLSMVCLGTEFMFNYLFHWCSLIHPRMVTCFVSNLQLSICSGCFFIANLAKFDQAKILEHILADYQSYHMRKLTSVNLFPVSMMHYEPIPPLIHLYTLSA
jgi:hypothetical protein